MSISWHPAKDLVSAVRARLDEVEVVLDIGCGIRPQQLVTPSVHVCCEPYDTYADRLLADAAGKPGRTFVVLRQTWADAVRTFPERSVDTVFILDVIEHLEKAEGEALLRATEKLARRQVVVFTPLGFMPQTLAEGTDAWGLGGSVVQEHKSGWNPEDFGEGWEILACERFHESDAEGRTLPKPFGAFFAVRTIDARSPALVAREELLRRLRARAADIRDDRVLAATAEFVGLAARVFKPSMMAPPRMLLAASIALRDTGIVRAVHRGWVRLFSAPR